MASSVQHLLCAPLRWFLIRERAPLRSSATPLPLTAPTFRIGPATTHTMAMSILRAAGSGLARRAAAAAAPGSAAGAQQVCAKKNKTKNTKLLPKVFHFDSVKPFSFTEPTGFGVWMCLFCAREGEGDARLSLESAA